jgi:hypothetical protein
LMTKSERFIEVCKKVENYYMNHYQEYMWVLTSRRNFQFLTFHI